MPLYFNSRHLPHPTGEYVLWFDGMGTGRALIHSLHNAANFVFKLHAALDRAIAPGDPVHVYPIMDGLYLSTNARAVMQAAIRRAFVELADEFLAHAAEDITRRFMARGGLAFGATLHGADVSPDAFVHGIGTPYEGQNRASFADSRLNDTRSRLLLCSAMVAAYEAEKSAPPFGIFVDDSAQLADRTACGFQGSLWRWWYGDPYAEDIVQRLWPAIRDYLDEAERRSPELGYPLESIRRHRDAATEYFRHVPAA